MFISRSFFLPILCRHHDAFQTVSFLSLPLFSSPPVILYSFGHLPFPPISPNFVSPVFTFPSLLSFFSIFLFHLFLFLLFCLLSLFSYFAFLELSFPPSLSLLLLFFHPPFFPLFLPFPSFFFLLFFPFYLLSLSLFLFPRPFFSFFLLFLSQFLFPRPFPSFLFLPSPFLHPSCPHPIPLPFSFFILLLYLLLSLSPIFLAAARLYLSRCQRGRRKDLARPPLLRPENRGFNTLPGNCEAERCRH